jgi:hypothetical protein
MMNACFRFMSLLPLLELRKQSYVVDISIYLHLNKSIKQIEL